MPEYTALISAYGPSGITLAVWAFSLKTVLPWVREYFTKQGEQLTRIADAIEAIRGQQSTFAHELAEVREDLADVQLDVARIYVIKQAEQPSRARRQQARQGASS